MQISDLDSFDTFADLDEQEKIIAANKLEIFSAKKNEKLFDIGDEDGNEFFLVSGDVELLAADGKKKKVRANEPVSRFPLALLRPRKFAGTVVSDSAKLIKIDIEILKNIKSSVPVAGDAFSSFSNIDEITYEQIDTKTDAVKEFLVLACDAITENRLNLGTFDTVSQTLFNVVNDPEVSLDTLASAVQLDAVASAKVIKAANSAFFSGVQKVDSVRTAVVRLGLNLSVQLVTVMVMKEVFSSKDENLHDAMNKLWASSLKLATYSVIVGKKSKGNFNQGQTLLAGLMSDIGALATIAYLDQYPSSLKKISHDILASKPIKRKLAKELLSHWCFPDTILQVIESSEQYDREIEQADLSDVVMLARLLIRRSAYRKLAVESIESTPAYQRLGFDPKDDQVIDNIAIEAQRYTEIFTSVAS